MCLTMGTEFVNGKLDALGVGTGGSAYDSAVRMMTAVFAWQNMDARGVKPSSMRAGDITIGSDVKGAIDQFMQLAETQIYAAALTNVGNKVDFFIHRNRGGQGL